MNRLRRAECPAGPVLVPEYMIPSENGPVIPRQLTDIIVFHQIIFIWNMFGTIFLLLGNRGISVVNIQLVAGRTKHKILGKTHRIKISVKSDAELGISPTIVCADTKTRLLLFLDFGSSMFMIWIDVSRHRNFRARCSRMNCPEILSP